MNPILRFLLGLDEGEVPAGGASRLEFSGLPHGPWLLAAAVVTALVIGLVILLYRSERELGPWRRLTLAALRIGALAVVIWILLNPRILTELHLTRQGSTIVLIDRSLSMSRTDEYEGPERVRLERASGLDLSKPVPRARLVAALIERTRFLEALGRANRVELYACGTRLRPLRPEELRASEPADLESRLGDALAELCRERRKNPVAAVVLLSDGRVTAGEALPEAAERMRRVLGAPLYAAGAGKEEIHFNYAVRELAAPQVVEVGFPFELTARIVLSGLPGTAIVKLRRAAEDGSGELQLEERSVELRGRRLETKLRFHDTPPRKGAYVYRLDILPDERETEVADNRKDLRVVAVEEKRRVLLLAGEPSFEYRFLRNALLRDEGVQASCWLATADPGYPQDGDVRIEAPPETDEALRAYDAVVAVDPDPSLLTPSFLAALARFVSEHGGGFAYVAGEIHTRAFAERGRGGYWGKLLPVEFTPGAAPRGDAGGWRPRLTAAGARHPIARLLDDPKLNLRLWSALPAFYWSFAGLRLRPAAVALAEAPGGEPLIALQRAGAGEVLFFACDEFWRWRAADVRLYERFWVGVVRYLAQGKTQGAERKVTITTDRDRYRQGETVRVAVEVQDGRGRPVELPRFEVAVRRLPSLLKSSAGAPEVAASAVPGAPRSSAPLTLALTPGGTPGSYEGLFRPPEPGRYAVTASAGGEASFEVERAGGELEDPSPDFDALREAARRTGGRFIELDELERLAGEIPPVTVTEILGRRATTVWDSGVLLGLFTGLLALEWILRKLWRLP